jgi:hypothetical protein
MVKKSGCRGVGKFLRHPAEFACYRLAAQCGRLDPGEICGELTGELLAKWLAYWQLTDQRDRRPGRG